MLNKKQNYKKLLIIAFIAIIIVIVGTSASLAFFTSTDSGTQQVFTTGTLKITYDTGADINATGMFPTTEDNASIHTFTVKNDGTIGAKYSISFDNVSLTKDDANTTSDNLSWKLYIATVNDTTYTVSGEAVASGTFGTSSNFTAGTTVLNILSDQTLAAGGNQPYILKIWLNETNTSQNDDQGLSLQTTVKVDATQQ